MESKREQAMVGVFVLVAVALLIVTIFVLSGTFNGSAVKYRAYFPFAGGLEPGSAVRYSGGPKVGRVEGVRLDPHDPSRLEIDFAVQAGLPVKVDSHVKIMSLSPLGDNHLEIEPGTANAALAPSGAVLPAEAFVDFNALTTKINDLAPEAQQLLAALTDRAKELKVTIARVNDVINDQNRANLAGILTESHGMIAENRAPVKATVQNVNAASAKLGPLFDDLRKTSAETNETLNHVEELIGENRSDIRQAVINLRRSLTNVSSITSHLDQTLEVNSDNIDQLLENLREVSDNLREFSGTLKSRPDSLIHTSSPRERQPGDTQ
jgi:phospholipid/cholesterol/gamma-HCH transport system substrate-binding protein